MLLSNTGSHNGVTLFNSNSVTVLANNSMTISAGTSYAVEMLIQSSNQPGACVLVSAYIGGVFACSAILSAVNQGFYTSSGLDGLWGYSGSGADDGGSRITDFSVTQATDLPYVYAGTATLSGGTIAVVNANVTSNSKVRVWNDSASGTVGALSVAVTPGTGFTVNSTSGSDASTVYYEITAY